MFKKTIIKSFLLVILGVLLLNACAPASNTTTTADQTTVQSAPTVTETPSASEVSLNTTYTNAVSIELQLLLGTIKLQGTELAITEEQASMLLPLWNNYKSLSQSMTPAQGTPGQGQDTATAQPQATSTETQQQIDAILTQIQAAMTPAQITAIAEMKITQETAMTMMQDQGITMGGAQPGNGNNADGSNQPPQGMPPAGGNQPPQGTPPAGSGAGAPPGGGQPGGGMVPPELIDTVIQSLGGNAASQSSSSTSASTTGGSGTSTSTSSTASAVYTQNGGSETKTDQTYNATNTDESAILVTNAGSLTLTNAAITTSGNTSSDDNSSFHGLNAAVLAESGSSINLSNSTITTSGSGANGAFATGSGSSVSLSNVTINATGDGGHGVMATQGGVMTLNDVNITTAGSHSGAIATDRGGETIVATGGTVTTSGQDSPGIYSTGDISVSDAVITVTGAESAVIEGANSITLLNTSLSSSMENKWGVMIYQSMSGDAEGTKGVFTMTGGSLANTATTGPLFFVTNSTAVITLKGVTVTTASGMLVDAGGTDRWGTSGSNGGTVILIADGQTLTGDLVADSLSSITTTLQNGSSLTGYINTANTALAVNLTLDSTSTWNVTADSYLTYLNDPSGISGTTITNITGNGHTVYYDKNACSELGGQTYTLSGGGYLKPAN